jgi:hypothetical protein
MQELVDWARRDPLIATTVGGVIAGSVVYLISHWVKVTQRVDVLAGLVVGVLAFLALLYVLYPPKIKTPPGGTASETPNPPPLSPPPPSPPPPITERIPPIAELISLLEESRQEEGIRKVFADLVEKPKDEPAEQGGRIYCFRQHGLEFVFDASDHLCTICFFPGVGDHHHHSAYKGDLPAGLKFDLLRRQVQDQIDKDQGAHVEPAPGKNDWSQYVLRDENRLYIHYDKIDGRILEVELSKRENLLQERAALAP